jgi:hypothetical protein
MTLLSPSEHADDIDWRIATACRLAQSQMPTLESALIETPVMAAAYAYSQALMQGGDTREAEAAYLAALNDLVTAFVIKLRDYRAEGVEL